jgi:hypothetical protein
VQKKFNETQKFKILQKKWYDKIAKKGFQDIEDTRHEQRYLKIWHSAYFQVTYSPAEFEFKRDYYCKASRFLHDHTFANELERKIWELHTEGFSLRKTATYLASQKIDCNKDAVFKIISRLKEILIYHYFESE